MIIVAPWAHSTEKKSFFWQGTSAQLCVLGETYKAIYGDTAYFSFSQSVISH